MKDTDFEDGLNTKTRWNLIWRIDQSEASYINFFYVKQMDESHGVDNRLSKESYIKSVVPTEGRRRLWKSHILRASG